MTLSFTSLSIRCTCRKALETFPWSICRRRRSKVHIKWQMKFNPSKCHVLRITRKQNPVESNCVLMGKVLDSVTHHPYLGIELSRNLDWGQQVNNKVMKANRSLGFLWRNLSSCREGVKEAAYKALVRPHVEYASSVWDPHLKKHIKQIEGVQRRAAHFIKNCYTREPGTVTNLLNELNWIPLKVQRTISRLTSFNKAIYGDGDLAFPDCVTSVEDIWGTLAKTSLLNCCQMLRHL